MTVADLHEELVYEDTENPEQDPDSQKVLPGGFVASPIQFFRTKPVYFIGFLIVLFLLCGSLLFIELQGQTGTAVLIQPTPTATTNLSVAEVTTSTPPITIVPSGPVTSKGPACPAGTPAKGWMYVYSPTGRYFQSRSLRFTGQPDHNLRGEPALYAEVVQCGRVVGKAWLCKAWNNRFQIMTEPK